MAAARKPRTKADTAAKPQQSAAVYATVNILPNFQVGDRLDEQLDPNVVAGLLERGEASRTKPKA